MGISNSPSISMSGLLILNLKKKTNINNHHLSPMQDKIYLDLDDGTCELLLTLHIMA